MRSCSAPLVVATDPERLRAAHDRRRSPHVRRSRAFRGRLEPLEGRTLLTFGTGGIVTTQTSGGTVVNALAIQPADQKIVLGGYNYVDGSGVNYPFCLVRYNTDGSLDSTFGSGGVVTTAVNKNHGDSIDSLLIQPNGQIVAGGYDWNDKNGTSQVIFAVARYNTNGSLDSSFGSGGTVTTSFPASDGSAQIGTVLLRSNGEILAVGSAVASSTDPSVALALYTASGTLDTTFGKKGTVVDSSLNSTVSTPNSQGGTTTVYKYFGPSGAALESDNSILVAGTYVTQTVVTTGSGSRSSTTVQDMAMLHYLANGARDQAFGTGGIAISPITPAGVTTSEAGGASVLVQPNGAIVVGGTATGANGYSDMVVARYNANGTPDTTFAGGAGYAVVDLGAASSISSTALQPNGQIVAAGRLAVGAPVPYEFATTRVNSDGSLDTTFGTNGAATTQVLYNESGSPVTGLETINSQTMIVDAATAYTSGSGSQEIAMVRYTSSGVLDSGAASAATTLTRSTSTSGAMASLAVSTLGGLRAGTSIGQAPPSFAGPTSAPPPLVPVPSLVPLALDSPDFFDTLLPGRKRR